MFELKISDIVNRIWLLLFAFQVSSTTHHWVLFPVLGHFFPFFKSLMHFLFSSHIITTACLMLFYSFLFQNRNLPMHVSAISVLSFLETFYVQNNSKILLRVLRAKSYSMFPTTCGYYIYIYLPCLEWNHQSLLDVYYHM